jgi:polysaccharide deacetylase family protein (PEP-CTERM system associated)
LARNPLNLEKIEPLDETGLRARVLTIDVEEWYHVNYVSADPSRIDTSVSTVYDNTMEILDILSRTGSKATFFVLGCVARTYPALVRAIDQNGHEIACHSDSHTLIYEQSASEFREDLKQAVGAISSQTGKKVIGFRAPSCSITDRNPWALDVLCEGGFLYDSSVFPIKNYMYGVANFPLRPCLLTTPKGSRLLEIPLPALDFGPLRIPFGGGVYLRMLPAILIRRLMSLAHSRGRAFMLYFHPSDIDTRHHKIQLSLRESFFHNVGRRGARQKIRSLLNDFKWTTISAAYSGHLRELRGV